LAKEFERSAVLSLEVEGGETVPHEAAEHVFEPRAVFVIERRTTLCTVFDFRWSESLGGLDLMAWNGLNGVEKGGVTKGGMELGAAEKERVCGKGTSSALAGEPGRCAESGGHSFFGGEVNGMVERVG
jgi:hypothetical protein